MHLLVEHVAVDVLPAKADAFLPRHTQSPIQLLQCGPEELSVAADILLGSLCHWVQHGLRSAACCSQGLKLKGFKSGAVLMTKMAELSDWQPSEIRDVERGFAVTSRRYRYRKSLSALRTRLPNCTDTRTMVARL